MPPPKQAPRPLVGSAAVESLSDTYWRRVLTTLPAWLVIWGFLVPFTVVLYGIVYEDCGWIPDPGTVSAFLGYVLRVARVRFIIGPPQVLSILYCVSAIQLGFISALVFARSRHSGPMAVGTFCALICLDAALTVITFWYATTGPLW